MRIIYVLPSLDTGGAELQTINQVNFLYKNNIGCELVILSSNTKNISSVELPANLVHVFSKNPYYTLNKGFIYKLPYMIRQFLSLIPKNEKVQIILILEPTHFVGRLVKFFRRGIVLHCYYRSIHFNEDESPFVNVFYSLNKFLSKKMDDSSLFISEAVRKNIRSIYFTKNELCLPNSLQARNIDHAEGRTLLAKYGIKQEYKILVAGRFHKVKGHEKFLEEFAGFIHALNLSPVEVALILVGDGPERQNIEEKIEELNIGAFVFLVGEQPHDVLLSLHKSCNLVVIPSLREGFGNVAIEGLMQKSLMLVSNVDGLGEIIEDNRNGFSYDVQQPGAAKEKLIFLYQNRSRTLMNPDALYEEFLAKYTLGSQMEKITEHLKKFE